MADFFARLIQRVVPKSYTQAMAEVSICRTFMENFSGDQVGMTQVEKRWPESSYFLLSREEQQASSALKPCVSLWAIYQAT